jgi:hypothetical protein
MLHAEKSALSRSNVLDSNKLSPAASSNIQVKEVKRTQSIDVSKLSFKTLLKQQHASPHPSSSFERPSKVFDDGLSKEGCMSASLINQNNSQLKNCKSQQHIVDKSKDNGGVSPSASR